LKPTILFGGTFNPLHIGHLMIAEQASIQLGARVVFLPSAKTPLKEGVPTESEDKHRVAMLEQALAPYPWAELCTYEIDNTTQAPFYAIDVVQELKARGVLSPDTFYLLGGDWVVDFHKWKEPEALSQETRLVLATRNETTPFNFPHTELGNTNLGVSSSAIRSLIKNGQSYQFLVTKEVSDYLQANGLYV